MKFLIRGKTNFLEIKLKNLEPTGEEIDPRTLVHFGTDLVSDDGIDWYIKGMEELDVDYLFISQQGERVNYAQSGKLLTVLTAYKKI